MRWLLKKLKQMRKHKHDYIIQHMGEYDECVCYICGKAKIVPVTDCHSKGRQSP